MYRGLVSCHGASLQKTRCIAAERIEGVSDELKDCHEGKKTHALSSFLFGWLEFRSEVRIRFLPKNWIRCFEQREMLKN